MWNRPFHINETLAVVCDAIEKAENNIREHIRTYYHNVGEEFITTLFYGQINYFLNEASKNRLIENAFFKDLKKAIGYDFCIDYDLLMQIKSTAAGLVADIVLHNKKIEGRTGGDFGLIIIHPSIHRDSKYLEIKKGQCSGLLCQAKLKDKDGIWNKFTPNQQKLLDQNSDFSSLALYSYADVERKNLDPISWTLFRDESFITIEEILKRDALAEIKLHDTKNILHLLGKKEIGTEDREIINTIISPSVRQHLELRIYWPGRDDDLQPIKIKIKQAQQTKQTVKNYL